MSRGVVVEDDFSVQFLARWKGDIVMMSERHFFDNPSNGKVVIKLSVLWIRCVWKHRSKEHLRITNRRGTLCQ